MQGPAVDTQAQPAAPTSKGRYESIDGRNAVNELQLSCFSGTLNIQMLLLLLLLLLLLPLLLLAAVNSEHLLSNAPEMVGTAADQSFSEAVGKGARP
jgi:ABC-type antimicrobial peptide transport system permease subunit